MHLTDRPNSRTAAGKTADAAIYFLKEEIVKRFESLLVVLIDHDQAFSSAARQDALKLEETYTRIGTAYFSLQDGGFEETMQTIENGMTQTSINRANNYDELLSIVFNDIQTKRGNEGYSIYRILFAVSPNRFSLNALKCLLLFSMYRNFLSIRGL